MHKGARSHITCVEALRSGLCHRMMATNARHVPRRVVSTASLESGKHLAAAFDSFVNQKGFKVLKTRAPSALISPTAVIAAQLDSLQMNDWPEPDSGILTAFAFSKVQPGLEQAHSANRVRTWAPEESWLTREEFVRLLHEPPYEYLLDNEGWAASSALVFPLPTSDQYAHQSVLVRKTLCGRTHPRQFAFTFFLERLSVGRHKDCWMTVAVRFEG